MESIKAGFKAAITWLDEFWTACSGTDRVLDALREAFGSVMQTLEDMGVIWNYLVGLLKDNGFLDDLGQAFDGAIDFILGLFRFFFAGLQAIMGLIKGLLTGDWGSFTEAVNKAIDAAKEAFGGLWKTVKAILNQIWELAKDIFSMIGDSIKNALSIDVDKWTQKLDPRNWFKSDAPEVMNEGLLAARGTSGMNADNRSTTVDSHATLNINTSSPAVAEMAIEKVVPGSRSNYVDQSAQALS